MYCMAPADILTTRHSSCTAPAEDSKPKQLFGVWLPVTVWPFSRRVLLFDGVERVDGGGSEARLARVAE